MTVNAQFEVIGFQVDDGGALKIQVEALDWQNIKVTINGESVRVSANEVLAVVNAAVRSKLK